MNQEHKMIANYSPNTARPKYMKQKLINLKEEIDKVQL